MKPYLLHTLKQIALLGAIKNKIEISSLDLAKQLYISQQTASRYLLALDKKGFISRDFGIKKQLIMITNAGEEVLHKEFLEYQQIFEFTDRIIFKGRVVSGLGEGKYYTEQEGYARQFTEKLGFRPHPGTLNVEIEHIEKNKLKFLRKKSAIEINEFKTKHRTFGGVRCFKAEINGVKGAIVLPARGHYSNVLEFIAPVLLREKLDLLNDDMTNISIYFDE
jgi:riboflavin kinase, archaea type